MHYAQSIIQIQTASCGYAVIDQAQARLRQMHGVYRSLLRVYAGDMGAYQDPKPATDVYAVKKSPTIWK